MTDYFPVFLLVAVYKAGNKVIHYSTGEIGRNNDLLGIAFDFLVVKIYFHKEVHAYLFAAVIADA